VISAVIVDFGGVVALEPTTEALARLQSSCGLDSADFGERWYRHRLSYDCGELSAAEYWQLVGIGEEARLEDVLAADAEAWSRCDPALIAWLSALRTAGFRTALLSNMPREQWSGLAPRFGEWLPHFDEVTLSFELGAAKPDERMYRHCLERLGVEPDAVLFVDDRPENVEAAEAIGLHALRYSGLDDLRTQLTARFDDALPLPTPA
jgi:putative hydrolase of the HAD superfamily